MKKRWCLVVRKGDVIRNRIEFVSRQAAQKAFETVLGSSGVYDFAVEVMP